MRKALIVGVNYYDVPGNNLTSCVQDAYSVNMVLRENSDGTKNFDTRLVVSVDEASKLSSRKLIELTEELFKDDNEVALFYYSGHGSIDSGGGHIVTSDYGKECIGFDMKTLLSIVNASPAKNKIIILDTCHSGFMGNVSNDTDLAVINEGVSILTASRKNESAIDEGNGSTFTKLLVDALSGVASNLLGQISPGSVYAHIDQSLGAWEQRPVFKTNVRNFVSLRNVQPPISLEDLKKITTLFDESFEFKLDPSFEPESDNPNPVNTEKFSILQKYNRVNLVVPVDEPHMYFAAMNSKSCKLTVVGEFYWKLVKKEKI